MPMWPQRNSSSEFIHVTNPQGDVLLDFFMTDEHVPLDLSSCILLGLIELHYRGNWLLCYGMHIGKLSNYLEPGCPLYSQTRYRITLMKSLMAVSSMTGNDSLHLSLFWSWKLHHQGFLKYVQDLDAVWYSWSALAQYTSRRRFFKIL